MTIAQETTTALSTPRARARVWRARRPRRGLAVVAAMTALLACWEALVRILHVSPRVLPAPSRIARAVGDDLPRILPAAGVTYLEAVSGLALGIAVAIVVAYALFLGPVVERAVTPLLVLSQAVPLVAIAPLMVIWFGFEMVSKVLVVALFAAFPVCIALLRGLQGAPEPLVETARTMGAGAWWTLMRVRTPAARPAFFSGVRIAATYGVASAATAEFLGARRGLGVYLLSAQSSFRTDLVFAAAAVMALLSLCLYGTAAAVDHLTRLRVRPGRTSPPGPPAAVDQPAAEIETSDVTRAYIAERGEVLAVDGLSMRIASGEFVALVGPSGCGKSTLLRLLAGLDESDAGVIAVDGSPAPARLGSFSYLPQSDALLPWLTARQNVAVARRLAGIPPRQAEDEASRALAAFDLDGFASSKPHELSGGMRSRVSLLRSTMQPARARLLDEPFAALDAVTRRRVHEWYARVCRGTTLLVTHDIPEAVFLADRVLVTSSRPARVLHEVRIDLPRPRIPETRRDPRFFELCTRIEALLDDAARSPSAPTKTPE